MPTHDTCQPPIPFPKTLERGALNSCIIEKNHRSLKRYMNMSKINFPLEEDIKYLPSFSKYVKELYTSHRKPKRINLYENIS